VPSRPAPIVLLRRWWVQRHPYLAGWITLGVDLKTGARVALPIEDLSRMMLLVGSTGAGKTNSLKLLLEAWLQHGLPAIYVCGKGDSVLARAVYAFARRLGRIAYLFDANEPPQSCTYNPVAHGDATSCADRITTIMDHSDQHWEKLDRGFLQLVFLVLAAAGIRVDLLQLARYLNTKSLLAALRRKGSHDILAVVWKGIVHVFDLTGHPTASRPILGRSQSREATSGGSLRCCIRGRLNRPWMR
jgi:type IV secretion system coupling TraD/TrwB family protein